MMADGKKEEKEVLTPKEAANYLRISQSALYRYMRNKQIPCFKVGNRWRFKKSVLDKWIEKEMLKSNK
jgi:excisionase family DNA binding protein